MNDVKRIIIVAIGAVFAIMLCVTIKNHADVEGWKTAYKYNIAIPATEQDQFNYDVDSKQGLVITQGGFKTAQGIKFDEMTKDFTYVEKVHEHYTRHTETYSCGTPKVPRTCTRTYYSWDRSGSEEKFAPKTTYFGREYDTNIFSFGSMVSTLDACSVTTNGTGGWFESKKGCHKDWGGEYFYDGSSDRYYYRAVPLEFTASFLTNTSNGNLASAFSGQILLETKSIEQMRKDSTSYGFWNNVWLVVGSVIILIGMSVLAYSWVMADGKWSTYE